MKNIIKALYRPKILLAIIFLQSLTLFAVYFSLPQEKSNSVPQILAETDGNNDEEVKSCLKLPFVERPVCAKLIGMRLANTPMDIKEKISYCFKLRPYYAHFCLDEVRSKVISEESP